MIKWVIGIVVIGFAGITAFQLVPVYIHNHAVAKIAQQIVSDPELKNRPKREVLSTLRTRFADNSLTHLDPKEVVSVARDSNGELVLDVKYEERRKLMYNLEIVAGFDEQFTH